MQINGVNGTGVQGGMMGIGQGADAYSRQIQSQITDAQKRLQEISQDETLSFEEKMKKRQEIQQEISNLNIRLRQHQMEVRREKQKETNSGSGVTELTGGSQNNKNGKGVSQSAGMSEAGMSAVISAGTEMKQARIQGSVANKMENRAGVLKSEIKMDSASGSTEAKEKELAEVEKRAEDAASFQANTLRNVGEELKKADQSGNEAGEKKISGSEKAEEKKTSDTGKDEKNSLSGIEDEKTEKVSDSQDAAGNDKNTDMSEKAGSAGYTSVDIRL